MSPAGRHYAPRYCYIHAAAIFLRVFYYLISAIIHNAAATLADMPPLRCFDICYRCFIFRYYDAGYYHIFAAMPALLMPRRHDAATLRYGC